MKKIVLSLMFLSIAEAGFSSVFELKSWNSVVPAEDRANSVFSPVGLVVSMAMLGEGTGGTHRANISEALGLLSDFGNAFAHIFKSYAHASSSNQVSITLAPSMWSRKHHALDLDYRRSLQRNFEAETGELANVLPINSWTDVKTDGRIPAIIDAINPRTQILLLNAVAFEGAWKQGFDEKLTAMEDFTGEDGHLRQLPMMHGEAAVHRIVNKRFSAVKLPFAAEGVSMIYLLPAPGTTIADLRKSMNEDASFGELERFFRDHASEEEKRPLKLAIPRMTIASKWDLLPALSIFKVPVTGYSRIGPDFKINEVKQAAYIRIAETGYSLTPGATPPPPPPKKRGRNHDWDEDDSERPAAAKESFTLNRPFIYFVWDTGSETLLMAGQFMGR